MATNIIAVTGADSGLGKAVCSALENYTRRNYVIRINGPETAWGFDLTSMEQVFEAAEYIRNHDHTVKGRCLDQYRILINCAGVNYIEWFSQLDWKEWDRLMNLNCRAGIALTQELASDGILTDSWFNRNGAVLNIISNASHVPMTNSVFYNASKGAFHIATLAMARELRKTHNLNIFGISPNKLRNTGMSKYIGDRVPSLRGWSQEEAEKYQLQSLPAQEETDPEQLAEFIAFLLSKPERHKYLTNTVIPYGA